MQHTVIKACKTLMPQTLLECGFDFRSSHAEDCFYKTHGVFMIHAIWWSRTKAFPGHRVIRALVRLQIQPCTMPDSLKEFLMLELFWNKRVRICSQESVPNTCLHIYIDYVFANVTFCIGDRPYDSQERPQSNNGPFGIWLKYIS